MEKLIILHLFFVACVASRGKRVHVIHWNKANPMFRIDNTDNVIDVNVGNTRWEYDQANFICPQTNHANEAEESEHEKYIIYNVSKEEYDSCMVYRPSSRVVGTCTRPQELSYFTISFRSFTPVPGGLEFRPGQDYYFISTSGPNDLHRKNGGRCKTHNMKVIFKVANNSEEPKTTSSTSSTTSTTPEPQVFFDDKNKYYPVATFQDDTIEEDVDENTLETARKVVRDFQLKKKSFAQQNEVIKQEASRMQSEAAVFSSSASTPALLLLIFLTLMHHQWFL